MAGALALEGKLDKVSVKENKHGETEATVSFRIVSYSPEEELAGLVAITGYKVKLAIEEISKERRKSDEF